MDTVIMMSYADLLGYEQLDDGGHILVPAGFIFKYYKYLVKYIRLIVVRKFNLNTLDKDFLDAAKLLWEYALNDLRKHAESVRFGLDEHDPIILKYKNYLNEFHQNLFHNASFLSSKFPILIEIADEYQRLVFFVNKSRNLFRTLNESSKTTTTSIENIVIQFAKQELSKYSNSISKSISKSRSRHKKHSKHLAHKSTISGGSITTNTTNTTNTTTTTTTTTNNSNIQPQPYKKNIKNPIILTLDNGNNAEKDIVKHDSNVINNIDKLIKDEVNIYSTISKTLSRISSKKQITKKNKITKYRKIIKHTRKAQVHE